MVPDCTSRAPAVPVPGCTGLVERDGHGRRHAEAQFALRILHKDAHLVDQLGAHLGCVSTDFGVNSAVGEMKPIQPS